MAEEPVILLAGGPHAGTKTLFAALAATYGAPAGELTEWALADGARLRGCVAELRTKYYTAPVQLAMVELEEGTDSGVIAAALGARLQAIVLLMNLTDEDALFGVQLRFLSLLSDSAAPKRLCVGTHADLCDGLDGVDDRIAEAAAWCTVSGIELITANCTAPEDGSDSPGGKTGVPRVIEALEAHMWPGMRPLTAPLAAPLPVAAEEGKGEELEGDAAAAGKPIMLICGAAGSGKSTIASALAGAAAEVVGETWEASAMTIVNRYFTADIQLRCPVGAPQLPPAELLALVEGIALVVDSSVEDGWHALAAWAADALPQLSSCELRLLLLNKVDCVVDAAAFLPRKRALQEWCFDNRFELVEVDALHASRGGATDESRELSSIPRVREAMEMHTWSAMDMLTAARPRADDAPTHLPAMAARDALMKEGVSLDDMLERIGGMRHAFGVDEGGKEVEDSDSHAAGEGDAASVGGVVLVVGPAGAGKSSVIQSLLGASSDGARSDSPLGTVLARPWTLSTKYYTVDLQVWELSAEAPPAEIAPEAMNAIEAVVLVGDAMTDLMSWLPSWVAALEAIDPAVLLLAAHKQDLCETSIDWEMQVEAVQAWCIEEGVELVPTRHGQPVGEERPGEECEGLSRLLEALQCHTWAGMRFVTRSRPSTDPLLMHGAPSPASVDDVDVSIDMDVEGGGEGDGDAGDEDADDDDDDEPPALVEEEVLPRCANCNKVLESVLRCGACKETTYCSKDCQRKHWKIHKRTCPGRKTKKKKKEKKTATAPTTASKAGSSGSGVVDGGLPAALSAAAGLGAGEDLERLMAEVSRVAEASRSGEMSDAERRRAAADTAMRLWEMIGDDEEDAAGADSEEEAS